MNPEHDKIASNSESIEALSTAPSPGTPSPRTGWKRLRFLFKVVEIRLRFVLVIVATFVLIGNWDTLKNWWDKWTRPASTAVQKQTDTEYFCPMHPSVVRDSLDPDGSVPKCPICGMPLSLHKKGEHIDLPPGVESRVQLSSDRVSMANVKTVAVEYRPLTKEIQTVGFVDFDESRQFRIVSRAAGFIEKLYVSKSYTQVGKGEPLAVLYSPELASTAAELTLSINHGASDLVESAKQRLKNSGIDDKEIAEIVGTRELLNALSRGDKAALEQAEQKLTKLGMTDADIREIKSTRRAPNNIVIRSPVSGHVINKEAVEGASVQAGATLFDVADLTHVWIEADVFEADMPLLAAGEDVEATVEGLPNQIFHGQIVLVHPHLEAATRTNRIRIDLPNPGHALRPGMYATVKVKIPFDQVDPFKNELEAEAAGPQGIDDKSLIAFQKTCPVTGLKLGSMGPPVKMVAAKKTVFLCCPNCTDKFKGATDEYLAKLAAPPRGGVLTVPEQAVIDTGSKKIVYVEREPGQFDGIAVELGPLSDGFYPVVKGLRVGDKVVAAGAFLVDADTRLNPGAAAAFVGATGGAKSVVQRAGDKSAAPAPTDEPSDRKSDDSPPSSAPAAPSTGPAAGQAATADKVTAATLAKPSADDLKSLEDLSPADRAAALAQQNCPITKNPLGLMGVPVKVDLGGGKTAFLCCDGCVKEATKEPAKTLEKLAEIARAVKEQRMK